MEDVRIVECGPADAGELAEIATATFRETYAADMPPEDMRRYLDEAYRPATIRAELETPGSRFFITRAEDGAAGYMKLNTGDAQGERLDGVGLEIEALYLDRRFHGRGIGRGMLDHAVAEAEAVGADHVWLGVWELNRPAIRFYEHEGFEVVGSHPFRVGGLDHTDLIMRRELRPRA